ncbi:MAG TPA: hypothetical protein VFZ65_22000 [Planctomycetota bacterium]|nr:hypothetical protein [Planctomycetota bacterium]
MTNFSTHILPGALLGIVLAVVAGAVVYSVAASAKLPEGPVEVVWDKAACAGCGMHVGEPPFAAQLTTVDGRTQAFDDPGCLFLHVEEHHPDVHTIWFHHLRERRWLSDRAVAFVRVDKSPMGFGLGAVDVGTAGAIDIDEARRTCLRRVSDHGGK